MITRGWIVPNQLEYQIGEGKSLFSGFVECLEVLEDKNPLKYYQILSEVESLLFKPKELMQYAISHLGFMMVGEHHLKMVTCSGDNQHSEVLKEYEENGYAIHVYDYEVSS